jgi:hypothetical protein
MLNLTKGSGSYFLALNLFVMAALAAKPGQKIPEEVLRIDASLSGMKRDTAIVFGLSTEGAHLSAFSVDGRYKKFEVTFYGETGKTEAHYLPR